MGNISSEALCKFCDVIGVELCIIDGWKKYTLNNHHSNADLDFFIRQMANGVGEHQEFDAVGHQIKANAEKEKRHKAYAKEYAIKSRGKKRERTKEYRETDREGYNEYHKEYNRRKRLGLPTKDKEFAEIDICTKCANCEERLKEGYKHYCKLKDRYTMIEKCDSFEAK